MPDRDLFLKTTVAARYVGQLVQRHLDPVGIPAYLLALVTHVRDHRRSHRRGSPPRPASR